MSWDAWAIALAVLVLVSVGAAVRLRLHTYLRPGPKSRFRSGRLLLSIAVALLLGAGSRAILETFLRGDKPASDSGQLVATLPAGPGGAKAELLGGGYLNVPQGAVDRPTTINVSKRPVERQVTLDPPSGDDPLVFAPGSLSVYELTPIDTVLLRPVELVLPIPADQNVAVFVTANGETQILPGDTSGETAKILISSFDFNRPGAASVAR